MRKQDGYISLEDVAVAAFAIVTVLFFVLMIFSVLFVRFQPADGVVSGIVYNTSNDNFLSGKTTFSVRAAVDTYVTSENESSFCLPANSPYKALVNKAAQDKDIKVVVTTHKYFAIQAPWACSQNVTVTEAK